MKFNQYFSLREEYGEDSAGYPPDHIFHNAFNHIRPPRSSNHYPKAGPKDVTAVYQGSNGNGKNSSAINNDSVVSVLKDLEALENEVSKRFKSLKDRVQAMIL